MCGAVQEGRKDVLLNPPCYRKFCAVEGVQTKAASRSMEADGLKGKASREEVP